MENLEKTHTEEIINSYDNQPLAPEKTPLEEVFNPSPEPLAFDKSAPQTIKFEKEDENARYELEFKIEKLADADLTEFDKLSFVKVENQGKDQVFYSDDTDACDWFFEKNVTLVGGFDGELPPDWQKSFSLLERQQIVQAFLAVGVFEEEKTKTKQKFSFSTPSVKTVKLLASFGEFDVICTHTIPATSSAHLRKFKRITQGLVSRKGQKGTFLPSVWGKLAELYDEIGVESDNYINEPPINHKALVLREVFGEMLDEETKKSKR